MKCSLLFALALGVAGLAVVQGQCQTLAENCQNVLLAGSENISPSLPLSQIHDVICRLFNDYKDCLYQCTDEAFLDHVDDVFKKEEASLEDDYGIKCDGVLTAQFSPLLLVCIVYALLRPLL